MQTGDTSHGAWFCLWAQHTIGLYRFDLALDFNILQYLEIKKWGNQPVRWLSDLHCAGLSGLLHTSSQVDGITHGGVFHVQVGAYSTDNHQARVDAHTHRKVETPTLLYFLTKEVYGLHNS